MKLSLSRNSNHPRRNARPGRPGAGSPETNSSRILAFATQGAGGGDELRIRGLLENFAVEFYPFDRSKKVQSFWELLQRIRRQQFDLVLMEGTGVAGGFALIVGQLLNSTRYVVSSGDAVGPF